MNDLVTGIGEVLWDMLPDGRKIGGAPANFAYHISQFGLPGCVVSAVGRDSLGDEISAIVDAKGIINRIERTDYPTGTVKVEVDDAGIPQYDICSDVAWDHIPFTEHLEATARRTRAVCFGSLAQRSEESRRTINRFLDAMHRGSESLVVFDVNLRQNFFDREILTESIGRCDILKINDEELAVVSRMFNCSGGDDIEICREIISRFGLRILILTCGINGSHVVTGEDVSFLPTPRVDVADTVGAGDSFTAAFTASLLKGKSIAQAHRAAVDTSAFVCSHYGAMPELPAAITG